MTNEVRMGGMQNFDIRDFEKVLVEELVPHIDANFRTLTDQPNRAMAGLSMGSMETKAITRAILTSSRISASLAARQSIATMSKRRKVSKRKFRWSSSATAAKKLAKGVRGVVAIQPKVSSS